MDIFEIIKKRRCIRKFEKKDISDKEIETILEAATWAPSAGNLQSWFFVVVKNNEIKNKLARAALFQRFIGEAPVVIVSCADTRKSSLVYGKRGKELYAIQDATIASQNILLTAYSLGLGTCWVGAFNETKVRDILSLRKHMRPVAIIPVGYPSQNPRPRSRRPIEKVSKYI